MKKLIIGTDFSGIGSPEEALTELKNEGFLDFESEFACEIDKFARLSYKAIHNTKVMYEDITKRNHSEVPQLDLYVAGFPCQAFSIAGKQLGFEDVRGTLFFNVADFIRENEPKAFILENVKGLVSHDNGRTFQTIIDLLSNCGGTVNSQISLDYCQDGLGYHIYYQILNTKNYGIPQNRERIFIVGFKKPRNYSFPLPETLKLKLKHLLEGKVDKKYFLSEKTITNLFTKAGGKNGQFKPAKPLNIEKVSSCLNAGIHKMGRQDPYIEVKSATSKCFEKAKEGDSINYSIPTSKTRKGRLGKQISQTLDTSCNISVVIEDYRTDEGFRVRKKEISPCLTASMTVPNENMSRGNCVPFVINDRIRRLTPLECWRLQGFSDESFHKAEKVNSDTQLYKQAGNLITKDVIKKIIKKIYL